MTESLFGQQGAPYANFPAPGTRHEGTIVRLSQVQSRKFVPPNLRAAGKQGELEFWPDQRPKMTAIVTIQTTLRDPNIQGDDGQRSLWIKGKNMETAVKAGIRNAGASRRGLEVGGYFGMTFTHTTPPEFEGGSPAKHYEADYLVPEQNPHRADGDPWANAAPPEGFIVNPATTPVAPDPASVPRGGPAYVATPTNDPRAQQASATEQPAQASAAAPVAAAPSADPLAGFDLDKMTPAAVAALQAMLAQQAGGQQ
jgi:hypothetical protein